ncbi:hypothetical protein BU26DRAFT_219801 [Trematosphaeria pertusa]|uniref:Uncharacterized protein n=1 Tax=Trematosphaeria pertusa TaxID=390896 RepID=A0A6A6IVQ8_9PLEO|nr:uncharacterized protein BU26DRAFT_219801 [Trematosphaeria pertusa]KAF2253283.1 hypothetical protein BU26DRAFT_219801 [Trematosphaeria pertusa]
MRSAALAFSSPECPKTIMITRHGGIWDSQNSAETYFVPSFHIKKKTLGNTAMPPRWSGSSHFILICVLPLRPSPSPLSEEQTHSKVTNMESLASGLDISRSLPLILILSFPSSFPPSRLGGVPFRDSKWVWNPRMCASQTGRARVRVLPLMGWVAVAVWQVRHGFKTKTTQTLEMETAGGS